MGHGPRGESQEGLVFIGHRNGLLHPSSLDRVIEDAKEHRWRDLKPLRQVEDRDQAGVSTSVLDVDDAPEAHRAPIGELFERESLGLAQLAQVHAKGMKSGVWMI